jgi:ABC-type multidrug transport system ATPase subunit
MVCGQVLDEATASCDVDADRAIQACVAGLKGVTVITIAHRLSTVMEYDRIAVLDAGMVKEFDTPAALQGDSTSYFTKLLKASENNITTDADTETDTDDTESDAESERDASTVGDSAFAVDAAGDADDKEIGGRNVGGYLDRGASLQSSTM